MVDIQTSSEMLDLADEVIVVPSRDEIRVRDPEVYMKRLAELQTPRERLIEFGKSLFYHRADSTHESNWVRGLTLYGAAIGWLLGGTLYSRDITQDYVRQHNAAVFEGTHKRSRHYLDNMIWGVTTRGAKYGIGTGLLLGSTGIISLGSINYRNKLYLPDWIVGFGTLGAITRCWLGPRAMAAGAGFGSAVGLFGYGVAKSLELVTGYSVTQIRYLWHIEYIQKQEAKLENLQRMRRDYERKHKLAEIQG